MNKNYRKKLYKKTIKKMDLLKGLKMPLTNFRFVMIYIIHKMLALLKITLIILKIIFSNAFLRSIIDRNKPLMFF